jgi:hypothetical protein
MTIRRFEWLFLCNLALVLPARGQASNVPTESSYTYRNRALGMTIILPQSGNWHIIGKATSLAAAEQTEKAPMPNGCVGPLCGRPQINEAMQSGPGQVILLGAYLLPPEYQNQSRHPLRDFAEVMILRNLGDFWIPEGALTPIRLCGRVAFRFIAHNRKMPTAKALMYVSTSNGYVFLLVGTALRNPEKLQVAIEGMKLGKSAP